MFAKKEKYLATLQRETDGCDVREAICSFTSKSPSFEKFSSVMHHFLVFMKVGKLRKFTLTFLTKIS